MQQWRTLIPGPNLPLCSTVPTLSLNTWGMFLERKNVPQVLVGRYLMYVLVTMEEDN